MKFLLALLFVLPAFGLGLNDYVFVAATTTSGGLTLNDSLVAYWPMDEASGTRVDADDDNDLTDNNTVASTTGIISNAGDFVRANSEYLSIADNTDLSMGSGVSFTVAAWVKIMAPTNASAEYVILGKDGTGQREWWLRYMSPGIGARYSFVTTHNGSTFPSINADSFGAPPTNTWHFVVAWFDDAADVNGIAVNGGTADTVANSNYAQDSGSAFRVGARAFAGAEDYFNGHIDEVGIWKRVLTAAERTALYNGGSGITCCPFP